MLVMSDYIWSTFVLVSYFCLFILLDRVAFFFSQTHSEYFHFYTISVIQTNVLDWIRYFKF